MVGDTPKPNAIAESHHFCAGDCFGNQSAGSTGLVWLLQGLVRGYQLLLSPFLGGRCRFYPSCSHYALEALSVHGAFRGSLLSFGRLMRCHPFHAGGLDPVPRPLRQTATRCYPQRNIDE